MLECTVVDSCPHGAICIGTECAQLCDARPCADGQACSKVQVGEYVYPVCMDAGSL